MSQLPAAPRSRRAAALAYTPREITGGRAPRVVAKGEAWLADQIIAQARAAGVPVHESRELVALLMQVDLDAHIPSALYIAVAEVLAWVYALEGRMATPSSRGTELC
jgi:flagellar biosynthesis protein